MIIEKSSEEKMHEGSLNFCKVLQLTGILSSLFICSKWKFSIYNYYFEKEEIVEMFHTQRLLALLQRIL